MISLILFSRSSRLIHLSPSFHQITSIAISHVRASVSTQSSLALSSEDVFQETQPFITSTAYQELLSFSWSCDGYESSNGSQYHAVRESQRENIFTNSRDSDISWVAISTVFCHHQNEAQDCKKNKTIEKKITFS